MPKVLKFNEANIQAEFYHQARLIDLPCALEVSTPVGRVDLAIMNPCFDAILAIIECKRERADFQNGRSEQMLRYKRIGVRVYELCRKEDCAGLAISIKHHTAYLAGVQLKDLKTRLKGAAKITKEQRLARKKTELAELLDGLNLRL